MEADVMGGEAGGGGGGGKKGMKFLGVAMAEPLSSSFDRLKALARTFEEKIRSSLWGRTVDVEDEATPRRSNPIKLDEEVDRRAAFGLSNLLQSPGWTEILLPNLKLFLGKIDILKRLQREAFFEIMKLRDRQDKMERTLALYRNGKQHQSPFNGDNTWMKGFVDVAGALLFARNDDYEADDMLKIAQIKTGIEARFVFETVTRQKDNLIAEFVASQETVGNLGDVPQSPLSLSKVLYSANISNQLSLIAIPIGARCRDFGSCSNLILSGGLKVPSFFGPALLHQNLGCAAGFRLKCSNFTASAAQAPSRLDMQLFSSARKCLATFGQLDYELFSGIKVSLMGIWQMPRSTFQLVGAPPRPVSPGCPGSHTSSQTEVEQSSPLNVREPAVLKPSGTLALMLESEFDDSSRLAGWIELQKSEQKSFQWALSLSDTPEDEVGWGLTVRGNHGGNREHVQLNGFLKVGVGRRLSLQPGFLYTMDGRTMFPSMVFHACWTL